ncbi:PIN domain-containing protein [Cupriavidus sp. H19C3]|uniref:DNA-binding protein n=1 Tax=Cupriavidus sp. H19C3 TaxID=3241603 RepID=UPI003BF81EB7
MEPQSSLPDNELLVVDTSVVINLNATGCAKEILDALPQHVAVVDVVVGELEYGRSKGRGDAAMLADLVKAGVVTVASLGETALPQFESLVVGASAETLDDGEAATIAYAIDTNASAIIDERKAMRLCSSRFPHIQLGCTLDLLSHQAVKHALGQPRLADALHTALLSARMRVLPHYVNWVVNLIGNERAAACHCLPETVRQAARNA